MFQTQVSKLHFATLLKIWAMEASDIGQDKMYKPLQCEKKT